MDGEPHTLYRSAGSFLRIRGTERFVHYNRFFPHQLQSDAEFWELCGIRLLRHALADAAAEGAPPMDVVGVEQTLSMLCGAILAHVLDAGAAGKPLVFGNCTIAMELEALKVLRPSRPGQAPVPVDLVLGRAAPEETRTLARFLHQEIDERAQHYPVRSIAPGPLRLEKVDPDAALLFLNHARQGIEDGPAALRAAVEHHAHTGMPVLILLRTAEHAPWQGLTVSGVRVEVPAHYALLDTIARDGVAGAHAFVEGFDRDFLLPPNEGCGLGIILLTRNEAHLALPGLRRFPGAPGAGGRELVSWGGTERHNYALSLNWELPDIAHPADWDWQAFKSAHDDALTAEALARQPSRASGSLLASFVTTMTEERSRAFPRHAEATQSVRQRCEAGDLPWSGGLRLARLANENGLNVLAWQAVTTALLDLGAYDMPAEAAFRRAEMVFGSLLVTLHAPEIGLETATAYRRTVSDAFAGAQLAALMAGCALRCDAPERLLMAASHLLHDPDWAPAAELMIAYARHRMAGGSGMPDLSALIIEREGTARERAVLSVMETITGSGVR